MSNTVLVEQRDWKLQHKTSFLAVTAQQPRCNSGVFQALGVRQSRHLQHKGDPDSPRDLLDTETDKKAGFLNPGKGSI